MLLLVKQEKKILKETWWEREVLDVGLGLGNKDTSHDVIYREHRSVEGSQKGVIWSLGPFTPCVDPKFATHKPLEYQPYVMQGAELVVTQ